MLRLLFIILLISIFFYVTSRFFLKLSSRPGGSARPLEAGDELVQDPNCRTYLSKKAALEVVKDGAAYYFCSPACAEAFEKKRVKKGD